jgi:Na+/proline symporter
LEAVLIFPNYIWLLIYISVIFSVSGIFIRKSISSFDEFAVASHSLGITFTFFTYFSTWISGATIVGLAGMTFKWGIYQYWVIGVAYLMGAIAAPIFLTRIRKLNVYTIGDFFALRFPVHGKIIRILVAISIVARNITIVGAQFSTIAFFISLSFGVNFYLALSLTAIFIVSYTAMSGMWGSAGTNVIQGLFQFIGLPLLLIYVIKYAGGLSEIFDFYNKIGGDQYLSIFGSTGKLKEVIIFLIAPGLFFLMEDQATWQRIISAKSEKVAFWGYLAPIGAAMVWVLFPCYIGVFSKTIFPSFTAFPVALSNFILSLPPAATIIILLTIISAAVSTCNTYLLTSGLSLTQDIYKKIFRNQAPEKELILVISLLIIFVGGLSLMASILIYDIFELYIFGAFLGGSILAVPYLLVWFSKSMNSNGIIAGMFSGGVSFVILVFLFEFSYGNGMATSLLINFSCAMIVSKLSKPPNKADIEGTYYLSEKFKDIKNIPK